MMIPENAYSILREDLKLYNDQFIQITKLSPRYASTKQGTKEKNRVAGQQNQENKNVINVKKISELSPQQGIEMINRHIKQFEKIVDQQQNEQTYNINANGKIITYELDKKMKIFNNEKSPLNKQMLINRFLQRNQKELNENYENIEDLRKPFGQRTHHTEASTEKEVEIKVDLQCGNKTKQQQKQQDCFQNTITNFKKNRSNINKDQCKSTNTPNVNDGYPEMNQQINGRRTPLSNYKKMEENIQSNAMIISTPNTIYSQNVYNRIILKQTERKKIKLQSIGPADNLTKPLQGLLGGEDFNSSQKFQLTKQNDSNSNMTHSFYNPESSNNIKKQQSGRVGIQYKSANKNAFHNQRSDSCQNPNQQHQNFYQVEQDYVSSLSPNKQISHRSRPQTHQQHRRKIYSSHQHYSQQQNQLELTANITSRTSKKTFRAVSPAQNIRNNDSSLISPNISFFKHPISQSNIAKNKTQQPQYQTLFQISSYHTQNKNNFFVNRTGEDENSSDRMNKSDFISNINLNKKRQGIQKQMNDFKQRVNKEKEMKLQEAKLKKNISKNEKDLAIEAFGFHSIKPFQQQNIIQNQNISNYNHNNIEFQGQMYQDLYMKSINIPYSENDLNPSNINFNDMNNMSITQLTDQQNLSLIDLDQQRKNQLRENKSKTLKSIDSNQFQESNGENQTIPQGQNAKSKEDEGVNSLRKSNKNLSKFEIIKSQIENEKKRKKMQEVVQQKDLEYQRLQKRKHLQNLYTRFLNQQGFSLYVNSKESPEFNCDSSTQLMTDISLTQNMRINSDSPSIKKLVKYYDNKYGEKFEQQSNLNNSQQTETFQNQTFGLYDQINLPINNDGNNLKNQFLANITNKKRIIHQKEKLIEMGPWNSQLEDDLEENYPVNSKKLV